MSLLEDSVSRGKAMAVVSAGHLYIPAIERTTMIRDPLRLCQPFWEKRRVCRYACASILVFFDSYGLTHLATEDDVVLTFILTVAGIFLKNTIE